MKIILTNNVFSTSSQHFGLVFTSNGNTGASTSINILNFTSSENECNTNTSKKLLILVLALVLMLASRTFSPKYTFLCLMLALVLVIVLGGFKQAFLKTTSKKINRYPLKYDGFNLNKLPCSVFDNDKSVC